MRVLFEHGKIAPLCAIVGQKVLPVEVWLLKFVETHKDHFCERQVPINNENVTVCRLSLRR